MSWQATSWAVRQQTGASSRKALLLVLANYADEHGVCWPSQETLKAETEMSLDTIQRQSKVLEKLGLIKMVRRRRKDGTWPSLQYHLNLTNDTSAIPQNAVWPERTMPHPAADHAALTTSTMPQSLRLKPSIVEPPREPSSAADDARAREPSKSLISAEAYSLRDDLMRMQHLDTDDPACIGMAYGAQAWLSKGWNADVVRQTVETVMSRRTSAPRSLRYFEAAIAEAHAERDRPLPIAHLSTNLSVKNHGTTQKQSGVVAAARRLAEQFESRSSDGIESNTTAVLRLPAG